MGGERRQKFVREVGSVVLGVLIALGLGAIATEIGWRVEVRGARAAMSGELGELIGQGEERVKIEACIERRLDDVARVVRDAERIGRLAPLGDIGLPPYRTWPRGVWQSTLDAQTAAHLDSELLDNYATAYDFADQMATLHRGELDIWTRLHTLSGPGRAFSAEEARTLELAISQARFANRMMALAGIRMKQVTSAYELGYDRAEADLYAKQPIAAFIICQPIATEIPTGYGQAPMRGVSQRALDNPITRASLGLGVKRQ
ncbi:hypothetical protein [Sphingomonas turrisvirgatae]|uniref:Uncharacterized protein n=1 Tax=Sphingomonas turrisvirgatae TaxID=1888892 RepID=A0A1E3LRP0_9SPHN|nr:hypothetical protein [Sphingomonas turrisvirgatae]ODP36416.1 hypothetical protein BFL28_05275 [Sphingomonas turrisvirgatae]